MVFLSVKHTVTAILFLALLTACGAAETTQAPAASPTTASQATALSQPETPVSPTLPPPFTATAVLPAPSATAAAPSPAPATTAPTQAQPASPAAFPDPQGYTWAPVAQGLEGPIGIANAADGSGRLFLLEKPGRIRILQGDNLLPEPFLDITDRVGSGGSEQGLLGLAFHPRYAETGSFFVNYTNQNGDTVIARFQVTAEDPNRAEPGSEARLLQVPQPYANHNGGQLAFGPNGYLYIGLGDGGSGGDPQGNGQSLDTLLGKILRIDVDSGDSYGIPPDNPFASGGGRPEIWAYGLRNPWRFSFDRLTHDLYIADVGQNQVEEIDYQPAGSPGGANFGWNYMEGTSPFQGTPPAGLELIPPVAEYSHSQGCSVTGGAVYRGSALPEFAGIYLFGDYCSGNVWGLLPPARNAPAAGAWPMELLFPNAGRITSFGEDEAGEIYLADYAGSILRLSQK